MENSESMMLLISRFESVLNQAEKDSENKKWGTYDNLIKEYKDIREKLLKYKETYRWLEELPIIDTVPDGERGGIVAGGPSITGMGTNEERAKYSEIIQKLSPFMKMLINIDFKKMNVSIITGEKANVDRNVGKVFVVHGHDDALKEKIARFLENLSIEPIILHEKPSAGKTIIEKLEKYSDVHYAIVLLTPDDFGGMQSDKKQVANTRARQNVVFELGYFIAKLGREKVVALHVDGVEIPSDYHAVVYVNYDERDGWKLKIAQELKSASFDIDMNKIK